MELNSRKGSTPICIGIHHHAFKIIDKHLPVCSE